MKVATLILSSCFAALASYSGGEAADQGQFNDIATGVLLMRESPLTREPDQRVTRMAECAAVLTVAGAQTPPPPAPRGQRMLETAERLHRLAVQSAERNGRTAADVTRTRDQTVAAINQLAANQPAQFGSWLQQGVEGCGLAEVMTDQELTG